MEIDEWSDKQIRHLAPLDGCECAFEECISKYKRHFEKGYIPNWTEEIFTIDKINMKNPVTYQVRDLNNENILGSFYTRELSPAKQNIFRIETVIKRDNKNKKALVNGLDTVISIILGFRFLI